MKTALAIVQCLTVWLLKGVIIGMGALIGYAILRALWGCFHAC